MAKKSWSNAQPDSEADWAFSEREVEAVEKVATDVTYKSSGLIERDDLAQELYLWLALRKKQRDKWAAGHAGTLYRRVQAEALHHVERERRHYEREVPTDFEEGWPE